MDKSGNPLILSIDDDQDTLKLIEKYVSKRGSSGSNGLYKEAHSKGNIAVESQESY